jgi:hypothetical protein
LKIWKITGSAVEPQLKIKKNIKTVFPDIGDAVFQLQRISKIFNQHTRYQQIKKRGLISFTKIDIKQLGQLVKSI